MSGRFSFSARHRDEIGRIDDRLTEEIDAIEDAVTRFRGDPPRDNFEKLLLREGIKDWRGRPITNVGSRREYLAVAKAAGSLLDALDKLGQWRKKELGDILAAYNDHPTIANQKDLDFPERLAPVAVIVDRLASEAKNLTPQRGRGQPRSRQRLVSSLVRIGLSAGLEPDDWLSTKPTGKLTRLTDLCLEAAGKDPMDKGAMSGIIRRALSYDKRDHTKAWQEARQWGAHCEQKCDPKTCDFCT